MTPLQAILLALIQGVTEFLPISSSAHLILMPYLLGWEDHNLRFDVFTNAGTLLAAMVYFRHDLWRAGRRAWHRPPELHRLGLGRSILIASVPALVIAALFYDWFATGARQPELIAVTSIGFGLLLWWADRRPDHGRRLDELTWRDALWIGGAQALALVPGTSRSGITITAGLFRGFERRDAARFSFLLAIPIGLLALAKDLVDLARGAVPPANWDALLLGFAVSAVSAYLVIGWLLAWLRRQSMTVFIVYRVVLGLVILAVVWWR